MQTVPLLRRGIRINAICPGPTDTPLARANPETWFKSGAQYREEVGLEIAMPLEQAYPLLFLCSPAASAITGFNLWTEQGRFTAAMTGAWLPDKPGVDVVLGRVALDENPG
jgi:NAD(P)-dependent dehydrogenase (short-subunit alcohol dehydrogenase family)